MRDRRCNRNVIHRALKAAVRISGASALFFALVNACSSGGDDSDSNTNWLQSCVTSAECKGGLVCVCGACNVECVDDSGCARLSAGAVCRGPSDGCARSRCASSRDDGPRDAATTDAPDVSAAGDSRDDDAAASDDGARGPYVPDLAGCAPDSEVVDVTVCETAVRCDGLLVEALCVGPPATGQPNPDDLWECRCVVNGLEQPPDGVARPQGADACGYGIEDCIATYGNASVFTDGGTCGRAGPPPGCIPIPPNPYGGAFEAGSFPEYPCLPETIWDTRECEEYALCSIFCDDDTDCPAVAGSDSTPTCHDGSCLLSCDASTTCPAGMVCTDRMTRVPSCTWVVDHACPLCRSVPGCR